MRQFFASEVNDQLQLTLLCSGKCCWALIAIWKGNVAGRLLSSFGEGGDVFLVGSQFMPSVMILTPKMFVPYHSNW